MGRFRSILAAIALLPFSLFTLPILAADDGSPAEQLQKLKTEFDTASQNFQKNYSAAKTDEERGKIAQTYPQPKAYADRIMAIADKAPKSDVEREALTWIVEKLYFDTPKTEKALQLLQANHIKSPDLEPAIRMSAYSEAENVPAFLRAIIKENPDKKLQAYATYNLGYVLKSRDSEKDHAEAEKLFETVRADFKDVDTELAKRAENELYEIRNLAIGQVAPDIKGFDVDGKEFALSEYRGRVVVLDFWGDW